MGGGGGVHFKTAEELVKLTAAGWQVFRARGWKVAPRSQHQVSARRPDSVCSSGVGATSVMESSLFFTGGRKLTCQHFVVSLLLTEHPWLFSSPGWTCL